MRAVLMICLLLVVIMCGAALVPDTETARPYLSGATLALALLVLIGLLLQPRRQAATPERVTEPVWPVPGQPETSHADAEVVQFLGMLQEKGRLVDFLMDDINAYSDAQVGAAARVIHAGCKGVLQEHFRITPVRREPEGSTVQVPTEYSAGEYRLVGRIAGPAPFTGVLVHRGWKADMVKLPQLLRGSTDQLPAIAPAEVEVK
jgi:hypothetical protein